MLESKLSQGRQAAAEARAEGEISHSLTIH